MFTVPKPQGGGRGDGQLHRSPLKPAVRARFRDLIVQAAAEDNLHLCNRLLVSVVSRLCPDSGFLACSGEADAPGSPSAAPRQRLGARDALGLLVTCCHRALAPAGGEAVDGTVAGVVRVLSARVCPCVGDGPPLPPCDPATQPTVVALARQVRSARRGVKRTATGGLGRGNTARGVPDQFAHSLRGYTHHDPPTLKPVAVAEEAGEGSASRTVRDMVRLRMARPRVSHHVLDTGASSDEEISDGPAPVPAPWKRSRLSELLARRGEGGPVPTPPVPPPDPPVVFGSTQDSAAPSGVPAVMPPSPEPPSFASESEGEAFGDFSTMFFHPALSGFEGGGSDDDSGSDGGGGGEEEEEETAPQEQPAPAQAKRRRRR